MFDVDKRMEELAVNIPAMRKEELRESVLYWRERAYGAEQALKG